MRDDLGDQGRGVVAPTEEPQPPGRAVGRAGRRALQGEAPRGIDGEQRQQLDQGVLRRHQRHAEGHRGHDLVGESQRPFVAMKPPGRLAEADPAGQQTEPVGVDRPSVARRVEQVRLHPQVVVDRVVARQGVARTEPCVPQRPSRGIQQRQGVPFEGPKQALAMALLCTQLGDAVVDRVAEHQRPRRRCDEKVEDPRPGRRRAALDLLARKIAVEHLRRDVQDLEEEALGIPQRRPELGELRHQAAPVFDLIATRPAGLELVRPGQRDERRARLAQLCEGIGEIEARRVVAAGPRADEGASDRPLDRLRGVEVGALSERLGPRERLFGGRLDLKKHLPGRSKPFEDIVERRHVGLGRGGTSRRRRCCHSDLDRAWRRQMTARLGRPSMGPSVPHGAALRGGRDATRTPVGRRSLRRPAAFAANSAVPRVASRPRGRGPIVAAGPWRPPDRGCRRSPVGSPEVAG